ncbi:MAG: glutamine-hydrolyzing carbamoyl-phosphate synthase small subunit [Desulfohalobiaceae bacterium]|nr:glutamine-hydrolyzing carbamoyl-phosphate synthase small subunit [Desulfohalobiaceae bacterium]
MRAILGLEDGTWFEGSSFTGAGEARGEVIFNTGMTGYQEILTDPSYAMQLVCMTYPHIGNYGINPEDGESDRIHAAGFIVRECCKRPSNWQSAESLPNYLLRHGVPGIEGIDTRALTRHIRIRGAMRACISTRERDPERVVDKAREIPPMEGLNLVDRVGPENPYIWTAEGPREARLDAEASPWSGKGLRIALLDLGAKRNILRLLTECGMDVLGLPPWSAYQDIARLAPDAVFLSNGPGDPAPLPEIRQTVSRLMEDYPMGGICLGHQILGLCLGGDSFKLKFGHHGVNHPVRDLASGKIEITSQNHGFCVDLSHREDITTTHINLNDNTLEGFRHKERPIMAVQHHPEAAPGPHDSRGFFREFAEMVRAGSRRSEI